MLKAPLVAYGVYRFKYNIGAVNKEKLQHVFKSKK